MTRENEGSERASWKSMGRIRLPLAWGLALCLLPVVAHHTASGVTAPRETDQAGSSHAIRFTASTEEPPLASRLEADMWGSGRSPAYVFLAWTAVGIPFLGALLAFAQCRTARSDVVCAVGAMLVLFGIAESAHAWAATNALETGSDSLTQTWFFSRMAKALVTLGWTSLLLLDTSARGRFPRYAIVASGALLSLAYLVSASLVEAGPPPFAAWAEPLRSLSLLTWFVFVVAAIGPLPRLRRRFGGPVFRALQLSVVPDLAVPLWLVFATRWELEGALLAAGFLKVTAYLVALTGIGVAYFSTFSRELVSGESYLDVVEELEQALALSGEMEKRLRSREIRLNQLTANIREIFWIVSPDGQKLHYVSPAYEEIVEESRKRVYDNPASFLDMIHPEDSERVQSAIRRELSYDFTVEFRIVVASGAVKWVCTRGFAIRDENGEIHRIGGITEDVTERKRADEALRRSEERNRSLLRGVPDLMFQMNRQGDFLDYHANKPGLLLVPPSEFIGRNIREVIPQLAAPVLECLRRANENHEPEILEYQLNTGSDRDFEARFIASGDEVFVIVHDITVGKSLEKEVLAVSDREQRRLSHDLHDGISQQLAGIALLAKALSGRLAAKSLPEADDANRIVALAKETISQVRELVRGLNPLQLQERSLSVALEELASRVRDIYRIDCRVVCDEDVVFADEASATHLYRIAREAVNNAVKHAEAKRIHVELTGRGERFVLVVRDDGKGLASVPIRRDGMGVEIMRYRARMIGASLDFTGSPGEGTVVTCRTIAQFEQRDVQEAQR